MGGWTDVQIRLASDGAGAFCEVKQAAQMRVPPAAEQQHGRLQPAFRNRMLDPSGCIVRWLMQPAHGHTVRIVLFQEA